MTLAHDLLAGLQVAAALAGATVCLWTLRRARRPEAAGQRSAYLSLTAGFALLTAGAVIEGVLYEFMAWSLTLAHAVEATMAAAGFAVILVAILRFQG